MSEYKDLVLTEKQKEAVQQVIFKEKFAGLEPQETPVVLAFGGAPGSGKTTMRRFVRKQEGRSGVKFFESDYDEFKVYHPHLKEFIRRDDMQAAHNGSEEISKWRDTTVDKASENKYNILFDGSMDDPEGTVERMKTFKQAGYKVEVNLLAVSPMTTWQSCVERYENVKELRNKYPDEKDKYLPRWIKKDFHDHLTTQQSKILDALEKEGVVDRITIWNRGLEKPVFDKQFSEPNPNPESGKAFEKEVGRKWTSAEKRKHMETWGKISQKIEKRNAPEGVKNAAKMCKRNAFRAIATGKYNTILKDSSQHFVELKTTAVKKEDTVTVTNLQQRIKTAMSNKQR
ncbi:MAG: zeta toxin family protein [Alphaproteobacteria bacterium]|nr:zeta toxin family protein [Alphaproteobacteria bacterium]